MEIFLMDKSMVKENKNLKGKHIKVNLFLIIKFMFR
jgi:hypothetical protein